MARTKYKYNPESLSYDQIRISFKKKILVFLSYLSIIFLFAIIINVLYSSIFDTPSEKRLKSQIIRRVNVQRFSEAERYNNWPEKDKEDLAKMCNPLATRYGYSL